ncbi:hypothetical protein BDZ89DRAFT_1143745 [Hymenopellis radicata]|nr:hypothetical protein BDZ89DRAFT_1143745 [Hymenopellis radicata]
MSRHREAAAVNTSTLNVTTCNAPSHRWNGICWHCRGVGLHYAVRWRITPTTQMDDDIGGSLLTIDNYQLACAPGPCLRLYTRAPSLLHRAQLRSFAHSKRGSPIFDSTNFGCKSSASSMNRKQQKPALLTSRPIGPTSNDNEFQRSADSVAGVDDGKRYDDGRRTTSAGVYDEAGLRLLEIIDRGG